MPTEQEQIHTCIKAGVHLARKLEAVQQELIAVKVERDAYRVTLQDIRDNYIGNRRYDLALVLDKVSNVLASMGTER